MEGEHGSAGRFRVHGKAAGGHRPHCGRIRVAEEGGRAELDWVVPVPQGEDWVVFGACGAAVLPLFWLPCVGGRLFVRSETREHNLSGSGAGGGAEARYSAAED